MKRRLFIIFLLPLFNLNAFAQTAIESTIDEVKIFQQYAQITRNASFVSTAATQEIVLTGISTKITPSSLQVQFGNSNATLLSAKYEKNYLLSTTNNKQTEELQKQLDILNEELSLLNDRKSSLIGMEEILNKNKDLGNGNAGFTAQQVVQLINSYEVEYLKIKKSLRDLSKEEKPLIENIEKIGNQLNEVNAKFNKPSGNIILQITSEIQKLVAVKCKYIVNNTGWDPIYDLRSEGISENVQLNYKANVYQNTGVDWENVSLIISTGNPSQNNERPILSPLYAKVYERAMMNESALRFEKNSITNMALDMNDFIIDLPLISKNQLSIDFNIADKQTINSDRKGNSVTLKTYELNTEYVYHSVPKLDKGAFLLAKISDWTQYNLVAGNANIFFEGGFVGTSIINPQVTSDSLLISMGLDNNIIVERLPIKEFTTSKLIGTNKKETIGYELIVKNKKSVPIKIELLDQIPVSQNNVIQINLEEKGNATYTEDIGKLLWTMNIEAGQTKTEKFIYTAKYPKQASITGIK